MRSIVLEGMSEGSDRPRVDGYGGRDPKEDRHRSPEVLTFFPTGRQSLDRDTLEDIEREAMERRRAPYRFLAIILVLIALIYIAGMGWEYLNLGLHAEGSYSGPETGHEDVSYEYTSWFFVVSGLLMILSASTAAVGVLGLRGNMGTPLVLGVIYPLLPSAAFDMYEGSEFAIPALFVAMGGLWCAVMARSEVFSKSRRFGAAACVMFMAASGFCLVAGLQDILWFGLVDEWVWDADLQKEVRVGLLFIGWDVIYTGIYKLLTTCVLLMGAAYAITGRHIHLVIIGVAMGIVAGLLDMRKVAVINLFGPFIIATVIVGMVMFMIPWLDRKATEVEG